MICPNCTYDRVRGEARYCPRCGTRLPAQPPAVVDTNQGAARTATPPDGSVFGTTGFIGREWVFRAIDGWLADPKRPRFFLLTGEPGSGKTAIAARLAQFSAGIAVRQRPTRLLADFLSAAHFCSTREAIRISPLTFAESLALQLALRYTAFRSALEASKDRNIHIEVNQNVQRVEGQLTGVSIQNLNVGGMAPEDAFIRVVREPLDALFRGGFDGEIVILVDALDEALQYSGSVGGSIGIVELLARAGELPAGVRFILTGRREDRIKHAFRDAEILFLSEGQFDRQNQQDVRAYIEAQLRDDELLSRGAGDMTKDQVRRLIAALTESAAGNFLYIRFLLDELARGQRTFGDLEGLPEGLDSLYHESLGRVIKPGDSWLAGYAPVLGVLSVARQSVTGAQIQAFTGLAEEATRKYLSDLQQFIRQAGPPPAEAGARYQLYHQSVIDFLRREAVGPPQKQLQNEFYLAAQPWHRRIAGYYWTAYGADWQRCSDPYGLDNLAAHIFESGDGQRLQELIGEAWMRARYAGSGATHTGFLADVELAWQAALANNRGTAKLLDLIRLQTARQVVGLQVSQYTDTDLETLVWLGRAGEALAHARLRAQPKDRASGLLTIAAAFGAKGQPNGALLDEAREAIGAILEDQRRALALIRLAKAMERADDRRSSDTFEQALADARKVYHTGGGEFLAIRVLQAGRPDDARQLVTSIGDERLRSYELSWLVGALARDGRYDQASDIVPAIPRAEQQVDALVALATALGQRGDDRAQGFFDTALEIANQGLDSFWGESALKDIAIGLAKAGRFEPGVTLAHSIPSDWLKEQTLKEISIERALRHAQGAMAQLGEYSGRAQFDLALAVLDDYRELREAADALNELVEKLSEVKRWREAREVADSIRDEYIRASALSTLARAMAESQQYDPALACAEAIQDDTRRADTLRALAHILASAGDPRAQEFFDRALAAAAVVVNPEAHAAAMHAVVQALVRVREFRSAEALARSIGQAHWRGQALAALANSLPHQQGKQAQAILDEALAVARECPQPYLRAQALRALAAGLAAIGGRRARAVLGEAIAVARECKDQDRHWFDVLTALSADLTRAGDIPRDQLANFLQALRAFIGSVGLAIPPHAIGLAELACNLTDMSLRLEQARRRKEARAIAQLIFWEDTQRSALAVALARRDRMLEASDLAYEIDHLWWRAKALGALGVAYVRAGQYQAASAIAHTILDEHQRASTASTELYAGSRSEALREIVAAFAQAQQHRQALALARAIPDRKERTLALCEIATTLHRAGDRRARSVLNYATAVARAIPVEYVRSEALSTLASTLAQAGRFADALAALGSREIDEFIQTLATWVPWFEQVAPGLSIDVLREAISVAGWVRPDWRAIHRQLSAAIDEE